MANEDVGYIDCMVRLNGPVRRNVKGKLYVMWEGKGIAQPVLPEFQQLILENAEMYATPEADYKGGGEPEPEQLAEPEPKPEAVAEKDKPTKSGFLTNFWGDDE